MTWFHRRLVFFFDVTIIALSLAAMVSGRSAGSEDAVTSATSGAAGSAGQVETSDQANFSYRVQSDGSIEVWASELTAAYGSDETAADALFKNKELVLLGRVEKTSGTGSSRPWISLSDGRGGKAIRCLLVPDASLAGAPENGGKAAVRGICKGMTLGITLQNARLVDFPLDGTATLQ